MFTGSFNIKQSDFPRQNDRKTEEVLENFAQTERQCMDCVTSEMINPQLNNKQC